MIARLAIHPLGPPERAVLMTHRFATRMRWTSTIRLQSAEPPLPVTTTVHQGEECTQIVQLSMCKWTCFPKDLVQWRGMTLIDHPPLCRL